jgi:hypothetical protein
LASHSLHINLIFILRETVTSYTASMLIESERHESLREAIIRLGVDMRPLDGPPAVVRTDPAPGFCSLVSDKLLERERFIIELGRTKNPNKNPVAEKAVQEIGEELLRYDPQGGSVSSLTLAIVTARLNARIRSSGMSAREMWTHRDQFTHEQIPVNDSELIRNKSKSRDSNHEYSERSKTPHCVSTNSASVAVGDIVYLKSERQKTHGRPRYLVTHADGEWVNIAKFAGTQLRSSTYRVKNSECFKVPTYMTTSAGRHYPHNVQSCDEDEDQTPEPPTPSPSVPDQLSRVYVPTPVCVGPPASASNSYEPNIDLASDLPSHSIESTYQQGILDDNIPHSLPYQEPPPRRSTRQHVRPKYLKDYVPDF